MLPTPRSFVSRSGTARGYEVRGWRYTGEAAWHLKVRQKGGRRDKAYLVREGEFNPKAANRKESLAVLGLIAQWEAEPSENSLSS